ncbi:MAG: hypothetical protein JW821_01445 [Deltaproteobacteria bacterium]|nr:hypothetical protein [Deltaproteobacteria bacterium]
MTGEKVDLHRTIQIGFDVLNLLAERFRQEMGRRFDEVWKEALSHLDGFAGELFVDIAPYRENADLNITILRTRYEDREGDKDEGMVLDAFTELIGEVIPPVRKHLGERLVEEAIEEAAGILAIIGKYQKDMVIAERLKQRLRG